MAEKHHGSIEKSILLNMILVPLIQLIIVAGTGYYYFTSFIERSAVSAMSRTAEDHGQMIETFLRERKSDLDLITDLYSYDEIIKEGFTRGLFEYLRKGSNAYVDLGIFNEQGVQVAYYGPYLLSGKEYGKEEWFNRTAEKGYYISDVFLGYRKVPHFIIAVRKTEGARIWTVRATIDTHMFNSLVRKVRMGKTGEAYILNKSGLFQTERRSEGSLMEKDSGLPGEFNYHEGIKSFFYRHEPDVEYLCSTRWLKEGEWVLVVRQQREDAFNTLRSASNLILLICILGCGIITVLSFYITDKIVRKMEEKDREKDKLNSQLIRAARLAELGEMSAGFAHEINNPLQIIKNEYTLITDIFSEMNEGGKIEEGDETTEIKDSLEQIYIQIGRCSEITQSILKFGRKNELKKGNVHIGLIIRDVMNMVRKKADVNGITVILDISRAPKSVYSDVGQLQQVFLNLINNAIDAIIELRGVKGGILEIGVYSTLEGGAEIRVRDNGSGISRENLKKIFSPFFTTKPVGKGTGLGLSVCYGIIQSMGGTLRFESVWGEGSTFIIQLPAGEKN